MPKEQRRRLSIDLTEEQYNRLGEVLNWGYKQPLFSVLVDQMIVVLETHGKKAIGAIAMGLLNPAEMIITKAMKEMEPPNEPKRSKKVNK